MDETMQKVKNDVLLPSGKLTCWPWKSPIFRGNSSSNPNNYQGLPQQPIQQRYVSPQDGQPIEVEEEYDETAEARRDGMGMGGMVPGHGDEAVENQRWQCWKK